MDVSNSVLSLLDTPGGFKNQTAIHSNRGLAILAALTLKNNERANPNFNNNHSKINNFNGLKINGFKKNGQTSVSSHHLLTTAPSTAVVSKASSSSLTTKITSSSNASKGALTSTILSNNSTTKKLHNNNDNNNNNKNNKSTIFSNDVVDTLSLTTSTALTSSSSNAGSKLISSLTASKVKTTTSTGAVSTAAVLEPITKTTSSTTKNKQIPSDILDDLACRFIINVPDMELTNLIRICFQIELAHWFYLDFYCTETALKTKMYSCGIKTFATQLFQHIPFLNQHLSSMDKILDDWKNYKLSVPTYGAILISEDLKYCLLVQSYFAKCSWGFPKGKINEHEDPLHCAIREVFEETGVDITELIVPNDYIEAVINYQYTRLYIVRNISFKTKFIPRTRNEIKSCDWFPIDSLPTSKNDAISKAKLGINANSFFMIMPFMKRLKKWVNDKRAGIEKRRKHSSSSGSQIVSTSPKSNSPINEMGTTQTTTSTTAIISASGGNFNNNNINNNQKHASANNSCKKVKHQQNNDDKNALNTTVLSSADVQASGNNGKRQRHKSMGDLDGVKCNNNKQNNCKSAINGTGAGAVASTAILGIASTTKSANVVTNKSNNNGSIPKRNSGNKVVAAGSNGLINKNGYHTTTKRQLFHSQTTNGVPQDEKIVSSFDLIRKERQQQWKAAAQAEKSAKAQKQQQQQNPQNNVNGCNNGRLRAKSQSDNISMQKQQQQLQILNKHNNNNHNNINDNNSKIQKQNKNNVRTTPPPQTSSSSASGKGTDIIAMLTAAAAAAAAAKETNQQQQQQTQQSYAAVVPKFPSMSAPNSVQKASPSSVFFNQAFPLGQTSMNGDIKGPVENQMLKLQQSQPVGKNIRILKKSEESNEKQSLQLQELLQKASQQQQQQSPPIKDIPIMEFTPNFSSWKNFTFSKNLLTNVFC